MSGNRFPERSVLKRFKICNFFHFITRGMGVHTLFPEEKWRYELASSQTWKWTMSDGASLKIRMGACAVTGVIVIPDMKLGTVVRKRLRCRYIICRFEAL